MEKVKNNITELVFILDRSGSMAGLESDTIGGFNSLIKKQKKQRGECFVSTVLFDNVSEVLHDRVKLSEIPKMTERDYFTRGSKALIDAIGGAIHHIGNIHKYARPEDVPEHIQCLLSSQMVINEDCRYASSRFATAPCSITAKRYIFNFEFKRRVPNGMHGGVRGWGQIRLTRFLYSIIGLLKR